jgi:hypothetical protein
MRKNTLIRIHTDTQKWNTLSACIEQMPTRPLKELLRAHAIPIPKMKSEMVIRLATVLRSRKLPVTIRIGA